MTFSTRNFDPLTPLAPKFPNFAIQILLFQNALLPSSHMHMCYKIFTPLGYGVLLAKNNVQDQNWRGARLGKHPKNLGPLCISATVEASNFKFGIQLGFVHHSLFCQFVCFYYLLPYYRKIKLLKRQLHRMLTHRMSAKLSLVIIKPPLAIARAAQCISAVHLFVCLSVAKMQETRFSQKLSNLVSCN